MAASALYRIGERPAVLGSAAMLWGWIKSASQRKPRYGDADFRRFLRRYQRRALLVCQLRSTIGWARKPAGAIHARPSPCWNSACSWGNACFAIPTPRAWRARSRSGSRSWTVTCSTRLTVSRLGSDSCRWGARRSSGAPTWRDSTRPCSSDRSPASCSPSNAGFVPASASAWTPRCATPRHSLQLDSIPIPLAASGTRFLPERPASTGRACGPSTHSCAGASGTASLSERPFHASRSNPWCLFIHPEESRS
jgi:hypothetical protein